MTTETVWEKNWTHSRLQCFIRLIDFRKSIVSRFPSWSCSKHAPESKLKKKNNLRRAVLAITCSSAAMWLIPSEFTYLMLRGRMQVLEPWAVFVRLLSLVNYSCFEDTETSILAWSSFCYFGLIAFHTWKTDSVAFKFKLCFVAWQHHVLILRFIFLNIKAYFLSLFFRPLTTVIIFFK